jgi:hypothetical protein
MSFCDVLCCFRFSPRSLNGNANFPSFSDGKASAVQTSASVFAVFAFQLRGNFIERAYSKDFSIETKKAKGLRKYFFTFDFLLLFKDKNCSSFQPDAM